MKATAIEFKKPIDFHCHFRQDKLLSYLVVESARFFKTALAMPNTLPPILSPADVIRYGAELRAAAQPGRWSNDKPLEFLLTFKITAATSPDSIKDLKSAGAIAGKLYPGGVTTNSEDGVEDFKALYPVFEEMQRHELTLCVHAEMPGSPIETAEADFIPVISDILINFPKLRVVFEHISTAIGVEFVKLHHASGNIAATVTPHHLILTRDDVFSNKKIDKPHHFCKPVCKTREDRRAIRKTVLYDHHPAFFLGTDSAPHPEESKTKDNPSAGIFNVGTAIPLLIDEFIAAEALHEFEGFTSVFGERFYRLEPHTEQTEYIRKEGTEIWPYWNPYEGMQIKPFGAGEEITWVLNESKHGLL